MNPRQPPSHSTATRLTRIQRFTLLAAALLAISPSVPAEEPHAYRELAGRAAVTSSIGWQDSIVFHYNRGNAAYRDGRFGEAVGAYEAALASGAQNSAVYYNLGNAFFRLGRIGKAVLAYERSVRLNPRDDDARQNLNFVSLLITDRVEEESLEVRAQESLRRGLGIIRVSWLAGCLSAGFFGLCLTGAWWLLGGRRGALTITTFALSGAFFLGSAGVAGIQHWISDEGNAAIVLSGQIEARFEPSESAKVAFVLHEGTKVWLEREDSSWALVRTANGLRGWLPENGINGI